MFNSKSLTFDLFNKDKRFGKGQKEKGLLWLNTKIKSSYSCKLFREPLDENITKLLTSDKRTIQKVHPNYSVRH